MKKNLLIISGSKEAAAGIKIAKRMGLHVVVSDIDPNAPGFAYADDYLIASTYDLSSTVRAAKDYHNCVRRFDGVISVAADVPCTVAAVATELGLPGISMECAYLASDKLAMKQKFEQNGIAIPWYKQVKSIDHLKNLILESSFPLILKPVDSRGARGVIRFSKDVNIEWAYEEALRFSSKKLPVSGITFSKSERTFFSSLGLMPEICTPAFFAVLFQLSLMEQFILLDFRIEIMNLWKRILRTSLRMEEICRVPYLKKQKRKYNF